MSAPYEPRDGDRVRIVCTGPTPGESIYEGVVHRKPVDVNGFELKGRWITGGKDIHLFFAVDRAAHPDSPPGFAQTTSLIRKAES